MYSHRPKRKTRQDDNRHRAFIISALEELKKHPHKLAIVKSNCAQFKQQAHLKRGLLIAVERFEWVFAIDDNIERICTQVLANDYIGNRIRRYPLLFKGVIGD